MLNELQLSVAAALVNGEQKKAIAENYGVSRTAIYDWLKLPEFQDTMKSLSDELYEENRLRLKVLSTKAIDALSRCLDGRFGMLAVKAAMTVLDRSGYACEQIVKQELSMGDKSNDTLTKAEIDAGIEAARRSQRLMLKDNVIE